MKDSSDVDPAATVAAIVRAEVHERTSALSSTYPDAEPLLAAVQDAVAGGKGLRPTFCYWGWRAAGGRASIDDTAVFRVGAAIELLHASALVHDDVMDASATRRGEPTLHRLLARVHETRGWRGSADRFGVGGAILAGDLLLGWADDVLRGVPVGQDSLQSLTAVFDTMRTEVAIGQFLDLAAQASPGAVSVEHAMVVLRVKSARYTVERPLQLGVTLAGRVANGVRDALARYGAAVGEAFQLRDDLLGVFGDPGVTGKPAGDDLREGKRTVLIALTYAGASNRDVSNLARLLGRPDLADAELAQLREIITGSGAVGAIERLIEARVRSATFALEGQALDPEAQSRLTELAVLATDRVR